MVQGCGANCTKFLVFFFNFLAFLAGIGILIACVIIYTNNSIEKNLLNEIPDFDFGSGYQSMRNVWIAGMVIGGIIMLLGFFGCCGAAMESQALLGIFGFFMIALVVAQLVVGILVFTKRNDIKSDFFNELKTRENAVNSSSDPLCASVQKWSKKLDCCGMDDQSFMIKCNLNCQGDQPKCDNVIWDTFVQLSGIVGGVVLAMIVLELAALLFACCLCCSIRHGKNLYEQFA